MRLESNSSEQTSPEHEVTTENSTGSEEESFLTELLESLDDEHSGERGNAEEPDNFAKISKDYFEAVQKESLRIASDPELNATDADIRFSTAMNLRAVRNASCCIIGAGGLGNWQWRILLSMGFRQLVIYDDDVVGIENVGSQAHSILDIGMPKVEAIRRAALQYRGIGIVAKNKRVMTLDDIKSDLGYVPDIIIGCTDSADFRNSFINSLETEIKGRIYNGITGTATNVPQLWIDYRMALGDWNAYIIPARAMVSVPTVRWHETISNFFTKYKEEACFSAEDAVQEACTERAISYTGASVASFTGALLHWWFSTGKNELMDMSRLYNGFLSQKMTQFSWKMSYSSRDFEPVSHTRREAFLMGKLADEKRRSAYKEKVLVDFMSAYTGIAMEQVWETGSVDELLEANPGSVWIFEEGMKMFVEFPDGKYRRLEVHPSSIPGSKKKLYSLGETVSDTDILGWENMHRYVCIPMPDTILSILSQDNPEEPVVIMPKVANGTQTHITIFKTQEFIDRNGGGFLVEDSGTGYLAEVYTLGYTTEEYRIMSIADVLNKYQDFYIPENYKSRVNELCNLCMLKRDMFVDFARTMMKASAEQGEPLEDDAEESSVPAEGGQEKDGTTSVCAGDIDRNGEDEWKDAEYVDSHDLMPGDTINIGTPGENYQVLETGRRLRLREMGTGDTFFCRHFSSRVMRAVSHP